MYCILYSHNGLVGSDSLFPSRFSEVRKSCLTYTVTINANIFTNSNRNGQFQLPIRTVQASRFTQGQNTSLSCFYNTIYIINQHPNIIRRNLILQDIPNFNLFYKVRNKSVKVKDYFKYFLNQHN